MKGGEKNLCTVNTILPGVLFKVAEEERKKYIL